MFQTAAERTFPEPVPLGAFFIAFLKVSLCGFGGGLVWAHRIAVDQRRWISEPEFADIVSLCQFMPGPNIVGTAVCAEALVRRAERAGAPVIALTVDVLTLPYVLPLIVIWRPRSRVREGNQLADCGCGLYPEIAFSIGINTNKTVSSEWVRPVVQVSVGAKGCRG
jgi:chromate transport protein ChrA